MNRTPATELIDQIKQAIEDRQESIPAMLQWLHILATRVGELEERERSRAKYELEQAEWE